MPYRTQTPAAALWSPREATAHGSSNHRLSSQEAGFDFQPKPAFDRYLRMHKVLVGPASCDSLLDIFCELYPSNYPHHLSAAGWAAVEATWAAEAMPKDIAHVL